MSGKKVIKAWAVLHQGTVMAYDDGLCPGGLLTVFATRKAALEEFSSRHVRPIEIHIPESSDER